MSMGITALSPGPGGRRDPGRWSGAGAGAGADPLERAVVVGAAEDRVVVADHVDVAVVLDAVGQRQVAEVSGVQPHGGRPDEVAAAAGDEAVGVDGLGGAAVVDGTGSDRAIGPQQG